MRRCDRSSSGVVQGGSLGPRDVQAGSQRARIYSDRFMLNWGWVQPRSETSVQVVREQTACSALSPRTGSAPVPVLWGNPECVYGSSARPPARSTTRLASLGELPPGGGGSLRAGRHLLDLPATVSSTGRTPRRYRSRPWQIWNEPNLSKFFAPYPSPSEYAQLLRISHNAIKGEDLNAQIVLAGMPGYGDVTAWPFLYGLYSAARGSSLLRRGCVASIRPRPRLSTSARSSGSAP